MRRIMPLLLIAVLLAPITYAAPDTAFSNVVGISVSLLNQNPDPALAGATVEVRLGIANTGGKAASNIMLELMPAYPFALVPGESAVQSIGTILGYQGQYDSNQKIVRYQLQVDKNAAAGNYTFKARTYDEGSKETLSQNTLSLYVTSKARAEVASIDNAVLVPGEQSSLKFTVNNVGNAPLRSLAFNWENEENIILPVGSDNTRYVKYIDVGGSAELEYQVIADNNANPGLYKLNLYLSYEDPATGAEKKISTIAGVYVGGGTDFDAAFSESSNGETSFSIANIGSNPAYSVSVSIPEQRGWRVSGSNSAMIGNLNKGDYTVASFKLQSLSAMNQNRSAGRNVSYMQAMPSQAPQTFMQMQNGSQDRVLMQIAYTDTMGARKAVEKEVKVTLQNATSTDRQISMQTGTLAQTESALLAYQWQIIGIAAILVAFLAYRRHENRKLLTAGLKAEASPKSGKR